MEVMDYKLTVYFYRKDNKREIYPGFEATFDSLLDAEVSVEYVADKWQDVCYSRVVKDDKELFYRASGKSISREKLTAFLQNKGIQEVTPNDTDKIYTCK